MKLYSYEEKFRANVKAREFYSAQPNSYRRPVNWRAMSAKKAETRWRRLAKVMEYSEKGAAFGLAKDVRP